MPTARICEEFLRADPARGEASPRSYASSPHSRRASSISSVRQASGDRDMAGGRAAQLGTSGAHVKRIGRVRALSVQESRRRGSKASEATRKGQPGQSLIRLTVSPRSSPAA